MCWVIRALLAININGSTGLRFTQGECRKWMVMQAVILQIIVTAVDIILVIRGMCPSRHAPYDTHDRLVFALYNRNRTLLTCIMIPFTGEVAVLCYILATVTPQLGFNAECFVVSSPHLFVAYWCLRSSFASAS